MESIRNGKETGPLTQSLENYQLTLGDMLNEFRHWGTPRSGASRKFRGWLDHENPGLVPSLKKVDLQRLIYLNNETKHRPDTPLSWTDAADMAKLSRGLLSAIIEYEPDGAAKK
jgi:hypothetical protein